MATASDMYALEIDQCVDLISVCGTHTTFVFEGYIGIGKSSMLPMVGNMPGFENHHRLYFDCTTKDLGDVMLPNFKSAARDDGGEASYVSFSTNEELGLHLQGPCIIMVDEYGKALPGVRRAINRLMLERKMGAYTLHPDSVVFATTNLGAENVGDVIQAHEGNRVTIVKMTKPTAENWVGWGINNGVDPIMLSWVKDNPNVLHTFDDVADPTDNPYIFHPREQRRSFVTPRSLEKASHILKQRAFLPDVSVTAALIGTIGERGAMDMMAHVKLADQLPSLESIKKDPKGAIVPTSAAAVCMVVYRTLATIEDTWVDNWMAYMGRLDKEAQALFANGVRKSGYARQGLVMTNKAFTTWAMSNGYMFAGDKT